ncbi:hypothetical protein INT45_002584 [Circinella minor]|uniref:Enoyl-CoA hydratase n=1 Tax=Circinella minor TaxID=1195481 RepID=A0A8H7VIB1_9FUNG|nr:hypothetical protein INT45_002584 [Circinella minor]
MESSILTLDQQENLVTTNTSTIANQDILLSIKNNVATITFNRPKRGNAMTVQMVEFILETLPELASDPNVRALVLTGNGKNFSTGMDMDMQGVQFPDFVERMRHYFDLGQRLLEAVNTFPKPVIARINGPCLGLAFGLVFTSDIRVASDTTYFKLPEVKEGLILVLSSPYIFTELTKLQAKEYALTGRAITATEAEGVFLNAVTKPSLLDKKINYYLSMLMDSAPEAMTKTKMLIDMISSGGDFEQFSRIMEVTNDAAEGMFSSEEAIYGVHSVFMHKKKPDWNEYLNFKSKL